MNKTLLICSHAGLFFCILVELPPFRSFCPGMAQHIAYKTLFNLLPRLFFQNDFVFGLVVLHGEPTKRKLQTRSSRKKQKSKPNQRIPTRPLATLSLSLSVSTGHTIWHMPPSTRASTLKSSYSPCAHHSADSLPIREHSVTPCQGHKSRQCV